MKRRLMLAILLMMSVLLAGCFNTGTVQETGNGTMKVQLEIPKMFQSEVGEQFISYTPDLTTVSVQIQMGNTVRTQTAAISGNTAEVIFSDVTIGSWDINATVLDSYQLPVYGGYSYATVSAGTITTAPIHLQMLPGDLNVEVSLPTDVGVAYGTVNLTDPRDPMNTQTRSLVLGPTVGTASFTGLVASTYPLYIELQDSQGMIVASGELVIDVLPGRLTTVNASSTSGAELLIDFTWELPPMAPTGLMASSDGYSVQLNWNSNPEMNIDGYVVYRNTINDPMSLECLTPNVIYETNFYDSNVMPGETYWYWVQAYNTAGYSSSLSQSTSITVGTSGVPTGRMIAVTKLNGTYSDSEVYLVSMDGTGEINLTNDSSTMNDFEDWSPDGTKILFSSGSANLETRNLFAMNADGTGLMQLTFSATDVLGGRWSPDGTKIIYGADNDYYVMNADGSGSHVNITNTPLVDEDEPCWSPDGTQILYSQYDGTNSELYLMNADGTNSRQLTSHGGYIMYYEWSPNGNQIAYEVDKVGDWQNIELHVVDPYTLDNMIVQTYQNDMGFPNWSPDGSRLVYRTMDSITSLWNLNIYDMTYGTKNTILSNQGFIGILPQWADDNTIVFIGDENSSVMSPDLWKITADGTVKTQLTFDSLEEAFFMVSPY